MEIPCSWPLHIRSSIANELRLTHLTRSRMMLLRRPSGGSYTPDNSYSMVARDLWQRKPRSCPRATPSDSSQFTAINPWLLNVRSGYPQMACLDRVYSTAHRQLDKRVRVTRVYEAPARESISGNRVYPVPCFECTRALARAHASIRDSTAKNLAIRELGIVLLPLFSQQAC